MFEFAHSQSALRNAITKAYRMDETTAVLSLAKSLATPADEQERIAKLAKTLIERVRSERSKASGVDALMQEFSLSSEEGVALMCLAESLLRIPDTATRDRLIQDKLSGGDWQSHLGNSPSMFVNAAAWGLVLTGKLTRPATDEGLGRHSLGQSKKAAHLLSAWASITQ